MPNQRYRSGANFEREVMKDLRERGYYVSRSAGSHSLVDVSAVKDGRFLLIQCKLTNRLGKAEEERLLDFERKYYVKAVIAYRAKEGRKNIVCYRSLGGECHV